MPVTSPPGADDAVDDPGPGPADRHPEAERGPESGRRRGGWRLALGVVVVAMAGMWGYVLYLAFGPGRQPPIDRLEDPAFAAAAEDRCADAGDAVGDLPFANQLPTAADRAAVLDQANGIYAGMLDDLDGLAALAPAGDQRDLVQEWLADWRTLLQDRVDYAVALRADPNARLLVSEKGDTGRHITGWIDEFALANRMESCATPTDV